MRNNDVKKHFTKKATYLLAKLDAGLRPNHEELDKVGQKLEGMIDRAIALVEKDKWANNRDEFRHIMEDFRSSRARIHRKLYCAKELEVFENAAEDMFRHNSPIRMMKIIGGILAAIISICCALKFKQGEHYEHKKPEPAKKPNIPSKLSPDAIDKIPQTTRVEFEPEKYIDRNTGRSFTRYAIRDAEVQERA